jgi:hypothetical protein
VGHETDDKKTYKILPGKPEAKRPFAGPMHILEESSKMDLTQIAHHDMDKMSFRSGQEQLAGSCQSCNELSRSVTGENCLAS